MSNNTRILNLTQHPSTADQKAAGVYDLVDTTKLKALLTFDTLPTYDEIVDRAIAIALIACEENVDDVMIGGAPYLMSALEEQLKLHSISPMYAFSVRESVEKVQDDGTVVKTNVFRHGGFVVVE